MSEDHVSTFLPLQGAAAGKLVTASMSCNHDQTVFTNGFSAISTRIARFPMLRTPGSSWAHLALLSSSPRSGPRSRGKNGGRRRRRRWPRRRRRGRNPCIVSISGNTRRRTSRDSPLDYGICASRLLPGSCPGTRHDATTWGSIGSRRPIPQLGQLHVDLVDPQY